MAHGSEIFVSAIAVKCSKRIKQFPIQFAWSVGIFSNLTPYCLVSILLFNFLSSGNFWEVADCFIIFLLRKNMITSFTL